MNIIVRQSARTVLTRPVITTRQCTQRCFRRAYTSEPTPHHPQQKQVPRSSLISRQTAKEWKELSTPQKVVAASKVTFNLGIIAVGVAVTSTLLYFVGSELFGSDSSTAVFSHAVDRITAHPELSEILGSPIKAHGEPSRRRNRRIQQQIVEDAQGQPHLFMRFYVEGPNAQGTAMLEMVKGEKGSWEYKRFFVDVPGQGYPSRRYFLDGQ